MFIITREARFHQQRMEWAGNEAAATVSEREAAQ